MAGAKHRHTQQFVTGKGMSRDAEYGLGLVTAGKPNEKKRRAADEKPMNNQNKKATRGKGSVKSKR